MSLLDTPLDQILGERSNLSLLGTPKKKTWNRENTVVFLFRVSFFSHFTQQEWKMSNVKLKFVYFLEEKRNFTLQVIENDSKKSKRPFLFFSKIETLVSLLGTPLDHIFRKKANLSLLGTVTIRHRGVYGK